MIFEELHEFKRDVKTLLKKYRSLNEDIEIIRKILNTLPEARPPFSFRIENLGIQTCIVKIKKMACKSLKGKGVNSGLRLIYAYFEKIEEKREDEIVVAEAKEEKIIFVEIYHKKDKANEDRKRILKYFD